MKDAYKMLLVAAGPLISGSTSWADTLPTHRIPAALAVEAANETVAACARQAIVKQQLCLKLAAPSLQRCAATVPVFTRSIAPTIKHTPLFHSKMIHSL